MTPDEARAVLGVAPGAGLAAVKIAYRTAARATHPDRPGAPRDATAMMTALNLAYEVLAGGAATHPGPDAPPPEAAADRATSPPATGRWPRPPGATAASGGEVGDAPAVHLDADGTLLVEAPADESFALLAEAAELLGDITYVDATEGLLQLLVHRDDPAGAGSGRPAPGAPWCSVTFSLQGRAAGTEVFATIESIDGQPPIALQPLLELLVACLPVPVDGPAGGTG